MKLNKTEALAGISTFLATVYIVAVNPAILSQAGMPFNAVVTATVLVSFFGSLMMGWYAKNPIIIAPGMGMNAFFTFTAVKYMGLSYQEALGAVFWAGVFFLLISILNLREAILKAIPDNIRKGVAVGIGLFICFVGLQNAHIIVGNSATLVSLRSFKDPLTLTFFIGLFITVILIIKKIPAALIIGLILTTLLCLPIGRYWGDASQINFGNPVLINFKGIFAWPDFSLLFKADIIGSLKFSFAPIIFAFVFTGMFDGISTLVGLAEAANLKDVNGNPKNIKQSLISDSVSTIIAGLTGSSPGTAYIESAVGIQQGGRTGQTAIVAAFMFLPLMFLSPLVALVPSTASSIALVIVGTYMIEPVNDIKWQNLEESFPAFMALVFIPFSFSITQGIIFGLLSYTLIKLFLGKYREVSPVLLIINILSIIALCI